MKFGKKDPQGLHDLLHLLGFKTEQKGENIIASGNHYFSSCGLCVWVKNYEEILHANAYGYVFTLKRWKLIFTPAKIESSDSFFKALTSVAYSSTIDLSKIKLSTDNRLAGF